ncbi:MAG TPA: hypothetical protein VGK94_13680 [Candidatus Polarisedimenticolia bacterium]|jgi:hypothetical protein
MGGNFAIEDNREILDRLEVLWLYPGGTLMPDEVTPNTFRSRSPVDRAGKHS